MRVRDALTPSQWRLLCRLHEQDREQREHGVGNEPSLRAVSAEVGELLYLLVCQRQAQVIVEFGTSCGVSTVYLGAAAQRTGGRVLSVDRCAEKTEAATRHLEEAELLDTVELSTADGAAFAAQLPTAIDFVLVDYPIEKFAEAYKNVRTRLSSGAGVFIDGAPPGYWDTSVGREFLSQLEDDPELVVSTLSMTKDHLLIVRVTPA